jgi:hypothetical protein
MIAVASWRPSLDRSANKINQNMTSYLIHAKESFTELAKAKESARSGANEVGVTVRDFLPAAPARLPVCQDP